VADALMTALFGFGRSQARTAMGLAPSSGPPPVRVGCLRTRALSRVHLLRAACLLGRARLQSRPARRKGPLVRDHQRAFALPSVPVQPS